MTKIAAGIRTLADSLARPWLLFFALPWLMFLLVLGTVSQRYLGLYQAQKLFFGSFILWVGIIPLPGAYATIGIIALGLCAKLILKSPLKKRSAGNIITHVSTLVLLLGGLITAVSREEGYMVLGQNDTSHVVSDYHQRELAIVKNDKLLLAIQDNKLHIGKIITSKGMPFSVNISHYCTNCKTVAREDSGVSMRGLATKLDIISVPADKEDAGNHAGALFEVHGAVVGDGMYLTSQGINEQPEIKIGKDTYQIFLRQTERDIPFNIHLLRFEKSEYPGTNVARSYRSDVEVVDGALKWNAVIEMNQPLRYRGYTLYQSSFIDTEGKLFTVLAVVKNSGEIFPYLAVTALCIGLIVHLMITFSRWKAV